MNESPRLRSMVPLPPPAPPRWTNPGGYSNGRSVFEVEKIYNQLPPRGIRAALKRWWMRLKYGQIHVWSEVERYECEN